MKDTKLKNISNTPDSVKQATLKFNNDRNYKKEKQLLKKCILLHKNNNELKDIAIKCGIIDITNPTRLSQYKRDISIYETSTSY